MESQQKQVIHLYEFKQQSINEKQLSKLILDSLKAYFGNNSPQIKIIGRPHKYWAYFQIEPTIATKLNELKTVKIGDSILNIGRYYYDYQIFINQLDPAITRNQVIQYFEQFGEVVDIVITDPAEKKAENFKHCYIKMKENNVIDQIVLAKIHKIQDKIVKPVRTFGLEEDKESDKKLFLKIERLDQNPASILEFEEKAIKYFSKHGKLRQRPKVQEIRSRITIAQLKQKMLITYTDSTSAASAIQNFTGSELYSEYKSMNVDLTLSYFNTRENKIYVSGLKENSQSAIKEAFQVFGQISQITLNKGKFNNTLSAAIGFTNENDFKMALASYQEYPKISALFTNGKPYVTIFMNVQQKKAFSQMKKKQYQGQSQFVQPSRPVQQAPFYPNPDQFVMNPQMRPMPVGQPGLMQPLMIPPGMSQPSMMQPGMMQPGMMQPGMMQPGMMPMQPGMMPINAGMGPKFQKPTPVPPQNN